MVLRIWNSYWFRAAPLFDLAVVRIVVVTVQLWHFPSLTQYRALADLPAALYQPGLLVQLLMFPFGMEQQPSYLEFSVVYWLVVMAGGLALIGLWTNLSLFVFAWGNAFLIALPYSFDDIHHPEALIAIALGVLAFSPCGRVLSVDDLRRRLSEASRTLKLEEFTILDEKSVFARWPLLVIQWLMTFAYLSAGLHKLSTSGLDWANGYTLQYYLLLDGIRKDGEIAVWLSQFPGLLSYLQWIVLVFQLTFVLCVLISVLRWVYLPTGIGFHTVIYITLGAPFFQWEFLYSAFIPWARAIGVPAMRWFPINPTDRPEVLYNGECPLCVRSMTLLRYFDWFGGIRYSNVLKRWPIVADRLPGLSLDDCLREMYLILPDGSNKKGPWAFREIIKHIPMLWPVLVLFYLPFASVLAPKIYNKVASTRLRISKCTTEACVRHFGDDRES
jgi:predicted DCC family thiol-disulfide oxidoreductase YuxK